MDFRRILKGPAIWIVVALLVLLVGSQALSGGGYQNIDTSDGL
jgi:cell division protease FtsH